MNNVIIFTIIVALMVGFVVFPMASSTSGIGKGHEKGLGKGHDKHGCGPDCPICGGNPCIPPCPGV